MTEKVFPLKDPIFPLKKRITHKRLGLLQEAALVAEDFFAKQRFATLQVVPTAQCCSAEAWRISAQAAGREHAGCATQVEGWAAQDLLG